MKAALDKRISRMIVLWVCLMISSTALSAECPGNIATDTFDYTGAIEIYTVPAGVNELHIIVRGAEGGNSSSTSPGLGAELEGDFAVSPGEQFRILVGGRITNGNGGGGGSFVTDLANNPVIIAGGGGGSSQGDDSLQKHGQAGTSGGNGAGGGGAGGTFGNGGSVGASGFQSGAGGGLLTNGMDGWATNTGGLAFINGGAGGSIFGLGGFGGGGAGSGFVVGGGGGGYSGGGSGGNSTGGVGGGGGSYNSGSNPVAKTGVWSGLGQVQICASSVSVEPIPTINEWGMIIMSLFLAGSAFWMMRRRQIS